MSLEEQIRLKFAEDSLVTNNPLMSAKGVVAYRWLIFIGLFIATSIFLALLGANHLSLGLHICASIFFAWCILIRFLALLGAAYKRFFLQGSKQIELHKLSETDLPNYTLLVALYQESNQVAALLKSLRGLDWPSEKLSIKLVLEADDAPTIDAVRSALAAGGRSNEELIIVPKTDLRTKPRALNYALESCESDFIVVYDAEDRPAPLQLKQAYSRFDELGQKLACVQAPLLIRNGRNGFLPTMFGLEYAALFRAYLPGLVQLGMAFPLGGTSNHLRLSAVRAVGSWDPYNVTEDADLGVRLTRAGYQLDVIDSATSEEAPSTLSVWIKQRTRWFKGWMQTCSVHLRQPLKTYKELGWLNFLGFALIFGGTLLSALLHPWIYWALFSAISAQLHTTSDVARLLRNIDIIEIYLSYVVYVCLVVLGTSGANVRHVFWWPIALPVYWLLSSVAAWRALIQLQFEPQLWEKTPHGDDS